MENRATLKKMARFSASVLYRNGNGGTGLVLGGESLSSACVISFDRGKRPSVQKGRRLWINSKLGRDLGLGLEIETISTGRAENVRHGRSCRKTGMQGNSWAISAVTLSTSVHRMDSFSFLSRQ
jgi:hypothetical protein